VAALNAGPPPAEITKSVQAELRRVGCLTGAADGDWNTASQRSLTLFNRYAGTKLDAKVASRDTLDAIKLKPSRVCPLVCEHGFKADGDRCTKISCAEGSFLNDDKIGLVWYPTDKLFSPSGVLVAGFGAERDDFGGPNSGKPTPFGTLPSVEDKLAASRSAVEKLHPGKSQLLAKPIYVPWSKVPYSLGCFANIFLPSSEPAYNQLEKPQGRTYFAGDYLSHLVAWQEGAILSAHHAIERIAKQIQA